MTSANEKEAALPARAITVLTRGLGTQLVLDCVGSEATIALAAQVARAEGELTIVGLAGGTHRLTLGSLPFECALAIPYWGSAVELIEVLELARQDKIRAHGERFPLEQAADAYQRLRDGKIDGHAVVVPHQ